MGFFDTLGELLDIGKDIVMLPAEIGKAATECGNDITEAVVQDVKNKVSGESHKEIRTSYDIRDEAEKLIQSGQDEYIHAKDRLDSTWDNMIEESRILAQKWATVYQLIGKAIHSVYIPNLPAPNERSIHYPTIPSLDSLQFDLGTYAGLMGVGMRMDVAEEYLQSAKEFRVEVKRTVSQINRLQKSVRAISQAHTEEKKMLDVIQRTYVKRAESTLIQSAGILREISDLLIDEVTSHTSQKYQSYLEQLQKLWE